jgi:hypothetical protein
MNQSFPIKTHRLRRKPVPTIIRVCVSVRARCRIAEPEAVADRSALLFCVYHCLFDTVQITRVKNSYLLGTPVVNLRETTR